MGDLLSQEEINALLGTGIESDEGDDFVSFDDVVGSDDDNDSDSSLPPSISSDQIDALGEIGNISMGTSATTLHALLGQKVLITTPRVTVIRWEAVAANYDRPCIAIRVNYVEGVQGSNVLLLRERDVKIITSLMMGGTGEIDENEGITELDLSAIGEAMNQMIGSASTSLSSLIKKKIDIDTPRPCVIDFNSAGFLDDLGFEDEHVVCTAFRMEIGTLIDSEIMQLLPIPFAVEMVETMKNDLMSPSSQPTASEISGGAKMDTPAIEQTPAPQAPPQYAPPPMADAQAPGYPPGYDPNAYAQPYPQQPYPHPPQYAPQYPQPPYAQQQFAPPPVNASPVQFSHLNPADVAQQKENIEIIMDVPLEVTVELGRTSRRIKEILEFAPGSIIELDKLAGEPIDILVNGKFVAKGEVVVIDENFGIRVTNIINAEFRI